MYEFIRGPMAWTCFFIFVFGSLFHIIRFIKLSEKPRRIELKPPLVLGEKPRSRSRITRKDITHWFARIKLTILGVSPFMVTVSFVFHVCIFIVPLFLMEHNSVVDVLWGVSFCPCVLSDRSVNFMVSVIIGCIIFFFLRRLLLKRVRSITSFHDFYMLFVTAAPFLTGILAARGFFDYKNMVILHVLSVELLLVSIPFTKFMHMIYFVINRFYLESEFSFFGGSRKWIT